MAITEFSFSVDDFENPKTYKDAEAIATLLVRLLILEPGTFQSHPDMGVGLYSNYAYILEGNASKLQSSFQHQIDTYLPQLTGVRVTVNEKGSVYYIMAQVEESVFGIYYDTKSQEIKTAVSTLSDL